MIIMKTTKKRKLNYKHLAEVLSVIALIAFAVKTHMLDGTIQSRCWGCFELYSISVLAIIVIENVAKLCNMIRQAKAVHL